MLIQKLGKEGVDAVGAAGEDQLGAVEEVFCSINLLVNSETGLGGEKATRFCFCPWLAAGL